MELNLSKKAILTNKKANGSITFREREELQPKKPKLKIAAKKTHFIKNEVEEAFLYWNKFGGTTHRKGTLTHEKCVSGLQKLFRKGFYRGLEGIDPKYTDTKFTPEDFMTSVDRLNSSLSPLYKPKNKKLLSGLSLPTFLYNKYAVKKSWFLHFHENRPELLIPLIDDRCPALTNSIKKKYIKECQGGIKRDFSVREENVFRKSSFLLMNIFRLNNGRMLPGITSRPGVMADVLFDAALEAAYGNRSKINIHWMAGDWVFERVPEAINKAGLFTQGNSI